MNMFVELTIASAFFNVSFNSESILLSLVVAWQGLAVQLGGKKEKSTKRQRQYTAVLKTALFCSAQAGVRSF